MKLFVKGVERLLATASLLLLLCAGSHTIRADDTEIYQSNYEAGSTGRPKVLIIFDTSGSMGTVVQAGGERPEYDPNGTYVKKFDNSRIYWSTDQNVPAANTSQYFTASSNRCASSYTPLSTVGKFTSKARYWRPYAASGNLKAEWRLLNTTDRSPMHVDCQADVVTPGNAGNGSGQGNPGNGYMFQPSATNAPNSQAYTANRTSSNINWTSVTTYTFYSAHYMDWFYDTTIQSVEKSRLKVAQEVVTSLIESNPMIDFGLAVFNYNHHSSYSSNDYDNANTHNGGRIVKRIVPSMTAAQRAEVMGVVSSFQASGSTPLCESTYEAYRYLSGQSLVYGDKRRTSNPVDLPDRDKLAESGGKYAPPTVDCAYTYVILMTDGEPQYDTYANSAIESLTGKTCGLYGVSGGGTKKNCLPTLTEYMANRDLDNNSSNGNQFAITYTIGFATQQKLLEDAATKGKGLYFPANNTEELAAAFQGAVLRILSTDSTFTSPSVAVNTFTRVQSRNEVFFAMFKPDTTMDWPGNIKRLDIAFQSGEAVLVDRYGVPAIDESTGIKDNVTTLWSTEADGGNVEKGGVGALLAKTNLAARAGRLWSNTGTNQALELFNTTNIDAAAYGFNITDPRGDNGNTALHEFWGVSDRTELDKIIRWGMGYDAPSNNNRSWILADILHSKPHIVNYGTRGLFTEANPDIRILVGTNAGFLHMFGNSDGEEDWAFFAKELGPALARRNQNRVSTQRVYGIDSPVVVDLEDRNKDGTIDHADGDKARVYFGLRRGGRQLYALDISNPDTPKFLWRISNESAGFSELGQTWSVPVVARIPGYKNPLGQHKPVLIFGGGYDPIKDDHNTLAGTNDDSMGRGVFIVDAVTGALVWSVTPAAKSGKNLQETGLHSMAAPVTALDSNGDNLIDRIYVADTGGNVWRIDLTGDVVPTSSQDTWRIVKLFAANGGTQRTDRRFFNAPDVVRTKVDGYPVDAILIGSGDRTNPAEVDDGVDNPAVDDQFYMIRDRAVNPYLTAKDTNRCSSEPAHDFRCSLPLTPDSLYNATNNHLQSGTAEQKVAAKQALSAASGWVMDLVANGEKALAESLTIAGTVYFTTFSPEIEATNICEPSPGSGRLYAVSLWGATAVRDFDGDGELSDLDRFAMVEGPIPDTPTPHFGEDGEIRLLLPGEDLRETGVTMPTAPYGTYWHMDNE